ncbi:hypothetical protein BDV96DRAFT_603243 [Lophiotrema nucula]|uniref:Uncharacterized protein n=1 Tax=Lophiotrema nucula TaxID=690887 RepID=A0A6A5YYD8_9PLEO|nr:hypothetical protein BDV96DRAFT_603243 [Lophiotrema nucula]
MPVQSRVSAFCVTGLLLIHLATSTPILDTRGDNLLASRLPKDIKPGKCPERNDWSTPESRRQQFNDGNAWELADRYLDLNDGDGGNAKKWASNMYAAAFSQNAISDFDCSTWQSKCDVPASCEDFAKVGWPGVFHITKSLSNLFTYLHRHWELADQMREKLKDDVPRMIESFGVEAEEAPAIGFGTILSGSLAIGGTLSAANPLLSGMFGVAGAIGSMYEDKLNGLSPEPFNPDDVEATLKEMIDHYCDILQRSSTEIRNAVFGVEAELGDKKYPDEFRDIPREMQLAGGDPNGKDPWNHAITYVIGDGQWLVDEPAKGLEAQFQETYKRTRQMLALALLRLGKGAVVVINERDGDDQSGEFCNSQQNNVWDPNEKFCFGMMWLKDGRLMGGINDPAYQLWDQWTGASESFEGVRSAQSGFGLDKLETYRNILDCWRSNDANMAAPQLDVSQPGTPLPRCLFSMEVKKGGWLDTKKGCYVGKNLILDTNFPNFPKDSDDQKNRRYAWPAPKADCETTHG